EQTVVFQIADQRGDDMIEDGQQRAQTVPDAAVRRDIIAIVVPSAGGGVVAEVDGYETRAAFDEPPREERLPGPVVVSVALDNLWRLAREVEGLLRAATG